MNFRSTGGLALAFAAGTAFTAQPSQAAFGFCSQPMAPSAFLNKPNKPYCAASRSCSEWEVESYRNNINRYFNDLKRYAGQVDDYYNDAQTYIECMADLD